MADRQRPWARAGLAAGEPRWDWVWILGLWACLQEDPGKRLGLELSWAWSREGHSGSLRMDRLRGWVLLVTPVTWSP